MVQSVRRRAEVTSTCPVLFTSGLFEPDNPLLADVLAGEGGPVRVMAVVDDGVAGRHPRLLGRLGAYARGHGGAMALSAPPLVVPGGRAARSDARLPACIRDAIDRGTGDARRPACVLAIGGTAVLDLAGYAAAGARRAGGVRLVRVPTTVLAQNDSSGFGMDLDGLLDAAGAPGAFAPPLAVVNDFSFLATLDERDWRAGVAEAVRVALVADPALFAAIVGRVRALMARDLAAMTGLIRRTVELHLEHAAAAAPGRAAFGASRPPPLDLGHRAAVRLIRLTDHRLRPGEALAIGMALDITYARLIGVLRRDDWERVLDLLEALGFVLYAPELSAQPDRPAHSRGALLRGPAAFPEPPPAAGRRPTLTLVERIGRPVTVDAVDEAAYVRAAAVLRARAEREARYRRRLPAAACL